MKLEKFKHLMALAGDAIVYYTSKNSRKKKYLVCTADLKSCKYIKDKLTDNSPLERDVVRVYSWDKDAFRLLDVNTVTQVVPLAEEMERNVRMANTRRPKQGGKNIPEGK